MARTEIQRRLILVSSGQIALLPVNPTARTYPQPATQPQFQQAQSQQIVSVIAQPTETLEYAQVIELTATAVHPGADC